MAIPEFIKALREKIGHAPLHLPGVTAVVLRDSADPHAFLGAPEVLLVQRADNGMWTPITGIVDPGEEPAVAAIREVKEETCLDVVAEAIIGCGAVGPVTHDNGDVSYYVDTALRMSVVGDDTPSVGDDESRDVRWFNIATLPSEVNPRFRLIIADAVAQRKRPEGFRPRMGYTKRERAQF